MFEQFATVRCVVVTGPQRSGTTIAAQMIAADTGHRFVDENEYGVFDVEAWRAVCAEPNVVVQCPTMLRVIVDERDPAKYAVLLRRPLAEIHASEDRIGWRYWEAGELAHYPGETDSAEAKYRYWDTAARLPPFCAELNYHSLRAHPLWVEDRAGFAAKQTA